VFAEITLNPHQSRLPKRYLCKRFSLCASLRICFFVTYFFARESFAKRALSYGQAMQKTKAKINLRLLCAFRLLFKQEKHLCLERNHDDDEIAMLLLNN